VVVVIGILVALLSLMLGKKWNAVLLVYYLIFIICMTLMYKAEGDAMGEMELFLFYKQFFSSPSLRLEILNNIWLFVPLTILRHMAEGVGSSDSCSYLGFPRSYTV